MTGSIVQLFGGPTLCFGHPQLFGKLAQYVQESMRGGIGCQLEEFLQPAAGAGAGVVAVGATVVLAGAAVADEDAVVRQPLGGTTCLALLV